jgi:diguanylate cyclase (GGDEF)-like protein
LLHYTQACAPDAREIAGARVTTEAQGRPQTTEERAYAWTRAVVTLVMVVLFATRVVTFEVRGHEIAYAVATVMMILVGVTFAIGVVAGRHVPTLMMAALPFDLVSLALFTAALERHFEDPIFAIAVGLPLLYALVVRKREAWLVGAATAVAYSTGHFTISDWTIQGYLIFALKTVSIPLIAMLVAASVEKQRMRERELARARDEKDELNIELHRRLAELGAVTEITEIVHSTLEFDRIGPMVLDILSKVIDISECALFIIDKERNETLFSASAGSATNIPALDPTMLATGTLTDDSHFACLTIFDHLDAMVLFCADSEEIDVLTDEDRLVLGAVASELVVAVENSRLYKLTRRLAITDELTGLNNYRFMQQRLEEEIERCRRYHKTISLLMLDADNFKSYNDRFGHVAGDVALTELAKVIRSQVRDVDIVCRYGGEEFSVVLPETDSAGAFVVAEKVREAVANHLFPDGDGVACTTLTVSIGLATFPTHSDGREALLREADDALYRAKNGGKNRVRTPVRGADRVAAHGVDSEAAAEIAARAHTGLPGESES